MRPAQLTALLLDNNIPALTHLPGEWKVGFTMSITDNRTTIRFRHNKSPDKWNLKRIQQLTAQTVRLLHKEKIRYIIKSGKIVVPIQIEEIP